MVFRGNKKEGLTLRPRVRRTTPLMDIAFAVIIGGASGVYIFNDSMRRWRQSELELAEGTGGPSASSASAAVASSTSKDSNQ